MQNNRLRVSGIASFIAFATILIFSASSPAQTPPAWFAKAAQIKLFDTSRTELETLFDRPVVIETSSGKAGITVGYKLKVGRLSVTYSKGNCSEENIYDYAVAAGVVTGVEISLDKAVEMSRLKLDLKKFNKVGIGDVPGLFNYTNTNEGIYFIGGESKLQEIEFSPTRQQEQLSCQLVIKNL